MFAALRGAIHRLTAPDAVKNAVWTDTAWGNLPTSGYTSSAGKFVSGDKSMQLSTVWACTQKNAGAIASMPRGLVAKDASGDRNTDQLWEVVAERPNPNQTGFEFWEAMVLHMLLRGNAYAEKGTIGRRLVRLDCLPGCEAELQPDRTIKYRVHDRGQYYELPQDKVFHLRGFSGGDGLGLSAIKYGANSMGVALAADEVAAKTFANGMVNSGVLSTDQGLKAEQRTQLRAMLDRYIGSDKAGKVLVLEGGLKFGSVQMTPEDAQLLDARRFAVEDICRWFGIPPIIIGHASQGQTMWGSGVEAILQQWLATGLNPLVHRIEARLNFDLLPADMRQRWRFDLDRDAIIQMDTDTKARLMQVTASTGTLTSNERRRGLGYPDHPNPAANELQIQGAMVPIGDTGREP